MNVGYLCNPCCVRPAFCSDFTLRNHEKGETQWVKQARTRYESISTGPSSSNSTVGRAAQAIKEGKVALSWTRLWCHGFDANQVRLFAFGGFVLAYNLSNFLRRLALPASVRDWTLTTLLVKLIKTRAKAVHHARYVIIQLAEVAAPRKILAEILTRRRKWAAKARVVNID